MAIRGSDPDLTARRTQSQSRTQAGSPAPAMIPGRTTLVESLGLAPQAPIQAKLAPTGAHGTAEAASPQAGPQPPTGPGAPLPRITLGKMQRAFGADFSAVRVHEDDLPRAMGALAYAQGNDLHFVPGAYRPGTADGDRLIGHELAHVVQQQHGRVATRAAGVVDEPALESEADSLGDRAGAPAESFSDEDADPSEPQRLLAQPLTPLAGPIDVALLQAVIDSYPSGGVAGINETSDYGKAVVAVWNYCNDNLPPQDAVQQYGASAVESELKRRTIGLLAARRARLEFLLGWMLQGGIHMTVQNWENYDGDNAQGTDSSSNSGTIVDKYTRFQSGYGLPNNDWCGMFVGFAFRHAGMQKSNRAYTELASTDRAIAWVQAQADLGTAGLQMTPDEIWSGAKTPQAGDVVVLEGHVSMVERFDSVTKQIDTIDGNVGLLFNNDYQANGVSGASYTETSGPLRILLVYRPGLEAFGATPAAAGAAPADNSAGDALVQQLEEACAQLTDLYQKLQLPGAVENAKSVSQIADNTAVAP